MYTKKEISEMLRRCADGTVSIRAKCGECPFESLYACQFKLMTAAAELLEADLKAVKPAAKK